jgi:integrase
MWRTARLGDIPTKTFDEACLRWLQERQKKSLDNDKTIIGFFIQFFRGRELSSIREADIANAMSKLVNRKHRENWEAMRDRLQRERKPVPRYVAQPVTQATKGKYLAFMRALLRAAANEWKWLDRVPTIKIPVPKNKRFRWISREEANRLIRELPDYLKPVVIFALQTGLRRSNIVDLEWQQVDMQRKVCWIHPEDAKAGKAIGVALNETACAVLRDQIGKHSTWVFVQETRTTRNKGKTAGVKRKLQVCANKAFQSACARAGIENFRFHDLRHTWASWLIQAGTPLSILQEMGGWESIEMVRRYAHLAPNQLAQHAAQLDGMIDAMVTNPVTASNETVVRLGLKY